MKARNPVREAGRELLHADSICYLLQVLGCWQVSILTTMSEVALWESPWGAWLWECWVSGIGPRSRVVGWGYCRLSEDGSRRQGFLRSWKTIFSLFLCPIMF